MLSYLSFSLGLGILAFVVSGHRLQAIFTAILTMALCYLFQPAIAVDFPAIWVIACVSLSIGGSMSVFRIDPDEPDRRDFGILALGGIAFFTFGMIAMLSSLTLFRANDYRAIIGTVAEGQFTTDVESIDQSQVRIVDSGLAERRAEELLGAEEGLGSRTKIGKPTIQSIGGKLYWAAPLEHSGFMTWWQNGTTPGYVLVSATNIQDARLMLDHPIAYGNDTFYMGRDVQRHLRGNGYATSGLTGFEFEVDDSFSPHWVVTVYENKVGFSGAKATGVVILDPQTGNTQYYDTAHLPAWVDRAEPEDLIKEQVADWGLYVHGYWNATSIGSNRDVVIPTDGMSLVYGSDGRAKWYTGIQSTGQDQGTIGFMLIDSRTGKATLYRKNGVTEDGAQAAIEGKVANFNGYHSTFPILYNVDGAPVFITTIKDGNGNFKGIGVASAQNRAIVAIGDTVAEALRKYAAALRLQGTASAVETGGLASLHQGHVSRIGSETIDGRTTWFMMLDGDTGTIFQVPAGMSPAAPVTRPGDRVTLEAYDAHGGILEAKSFVNADIQTDDGPNEARAKAYNAAVEKAGDDARVDGNLDARIRSMSEDEKEKLLKSLSSPSPADR